MLPKRGDILGRRMKVFGLLVLAMFLVLPASAQDRIVNNPAEHFNIAPGGVDLRTGRYVYEKTDLSVGNLALTRTVPEALRGHYNSFGNFSSNWDVMLSVYPWDTDGDGVKDDVRAVVRIRGLATTFAAENSSTEFVLKSDGNTAYLTYSGGTRTGATTIFTYTASDGTVILFRPIGGKDCVNDVEWNCAFASSITDPDGTKYTLSYGATGESGGNYVRLNTVVSSRGYELIFEGIGGTGGLGSRVTKACVINLALSTVSTTCPSNALAAATYAYSGTRLIGVTGPDTKTEGFGYVTGGPYNYQMQFIKPGQTTPWLTNDIYAPPTLVNEEEVPIEIVTAQSFADGRTYGYTYSQPPNAASIAGGGYVDNLGRGVSAPYGFPVLPGTGPNDTPPCNSFPCNVPAPDQFTSVYQQTAGPISITNALGKTTTFEYCDPVVMAGLPGWYQNRCVVAPLVSFTDPEGIKTELTYYNGRNVTQVRRKAKPGSGLPDIITSATYDCSNPKICSKPTSVTDAKGKTTSYTYKAETGDILTETRPADANGVQAVKRYAYVQRYAWISNGVGGYTQSALPIWLLSTMKTCRATATVNGACAGGGSDEVITSYEYGPDSGPNTLLLRGMAVTAEVNGTITTLRTCYGYDPLGRKISETKPRGTGSLTVCP